jgi:hypothetical protein
LRLATRFDVATLDDGSGGRAVARQARERQARGRSLAQEVACCRLVQRRVETVRLVQGLAESYSSRRRVQPRRPADFRRPPASSSADLGSRWRWVGRLDADVDAVCPDPSFWIDAMPEMDASPVGSTITSIDGFGVGADSQAPTIAMDSTRAIPQRRCIRKRRPGAAAAS